MFETLYCNRCWGSFQRQVKRGRKPELCPRCKPAPAVRRVPSPAMANRLIITDGGRNEIGIKDTNDCTVRAVALATGRGYAAAHKFLADNGRKRGKGAYFFGIIARNMRTPGHILGCTFTEVPVTRSRGLKTTLARNPHLRRGTWVLQMHHHVATLKDGKLMDSFDSSRKEVLGAWRISPVV